MPTGKVNGSIKQKVLDSSRQMKVAKMFLYTKVTLERSGIDNLADDQK